MATRGVASRGRPRSIAVYVPGLQAGGAERCAAVLASGFHRAGIATTLLVDYEADANRPFLDPGVHLVPLLGRHDQTLWRLARWLTRNKPDVALAIDAAANMKLVAAALLARVPTQVCLSYHGHSSIVRGRIGRAAYPLSPVLARLARRTICVSDGLRRHLVTDWHAPPDRLATIPNPIPLGHAHPANDAADLARRPPTILAVGRLVPEKRFEDLIASLAECPPETCLTILGEGPERPALLKAAAEAGLSARVSLPGYAEPWTAYAQARVFGLSSVSESFGNVVVEALASGLPVVATDCGGPREILDNGRFGRLVPVGDRAALAQALRAALSDPGDPAPRIARAQTYDAARIVEAYLDLFAD